MSGGELLAGLRAASLSGAVIILAALLLRTALQNRTPRRVFCLLWDVALVRLLILAALPSPVSVWRWVPATAPVQSQEMGPAAVPALTAPAIEAVVGNRAAAPGIAAPPPASAPGTGAVLTAVWLAAGLALAAWFLWNHLRFRRLCADSLPCGDAFVCGWLAAHPLCRGVRARTSDRVTAPLTYGVLRPVVLLPSGMDWPDRAALSCVLEHEFQHIRRFDTLRKALLAAALCLHWFNPLVWALYVLSNRDMELACDEAVTARGADRAGYARTLLRMEEQRGQWGLSGSHFSQNALEERIRCIMQYKKTSIAALVAVVTVMSITVAAFASNPPEGETESPDAPAKGYGYDHFQAVDENALLEELKKYGISGEKGNLVTSHGMLIRYLVDGVSVGDSGYSIQYVYSNPDGVVDVHTLRSVVRNPDGSYDPMGELIGTVATGAEQFDQGLIDSAAASAAGAQTVSADTDGEDVETLLKKYEPFGLRYEIYDVPGASGSLRMSWNGTPVHSLLDTETGTWYANNMHGTELDDGAVDLETVYRGGKLCGLRESQPPHEVIHRAEAADASGSGAEGGRTFEEVFARYQPYGLSYFPRESGMGSLTWNGQAVKSFADLKPDGGAFSYEDPYAETGLRVYAQYDASGRLTGLCAE